MRSKIFLKASLRLKLSWQECHGGPWRGVSRAQVTSQPDMMHGPWAERGRPSSRLRGQACSSPQLPRQRARMHFITQHDTQVMVTNGFSRRGRRSGGAASREDGSELGAGWGGGHLPRPPFSLHRRAPLCLNDCGFLFYSVNEYLFQSRHLKFIRDTAELFLRRKCQIPPTNA